MWQKIGQVISKRPKFPRPCDNLDPVDLTLERHDRQAKLYSTLTRDRPDPDELANRLREAGVEIDLEQDARVRTLQWQVNATRRTND